MHICSVKGCAVGVAVKGMCRAHYDCARTRGQEKSWKRRNPKRAAEIARKGNTKWKRVHPAHYLWITAQSRAPVPQGTAKVIKIEQVEELLAPMQCAATGKPLSWDDDRAWLPSIDRIDSSKGYTTDNVRLVCWAFNEIKGKYPDDFLRELLVDFMGSF